VWDFTYLCWNLTLWERKTFIRSNPLGQIIAMDHVIALWGYPPVFKRAFSAGLLRFQPIRRSNRLNQI
jgi:hypothetical protein